MQEAPAQRTLNQWELAALLSLASLGRIHLKVPIGNEKTPRPDLAELARIIWKDIDTITELFKSIEHILRELRDNPDKKQPTKLQRALTKALEALQDAEEIPTDCYPFLLALYQGITAALDNIRPIHQTPQHMDRVFRKRSSRKSTRAQPTISSGRAAATHPNRKR